MHQPFSRIFALCICICLLAACNREPEPRRYQEVVSRSGGGGLQSQSSLHITWTLPDRWLVQPEGDPLRLTGFWAPDPEVTHTGEADPRAVDVSIVQLDGTAGGLEANVTRWLGQIKVPASFTAQAMKAATPIRTSTGQLGLLVDLTGMLSGDITQSQSIIGAILEGDGYTVFVKAMGERRRLVKIKPQLIEFCRNLSIAPTAEKTP